MEVKISKNNNDIYLVELSGTLDLYSSHQLKNLFLKMIEKKAERFIISLKDIDSINSSGIGALIFIFSTLKKLNSPMVMLATDGPVLDALEITRLKNYFTIVKTLKEAVALVNANIADEEQSMPA
jgi:anti-sigma B factor antagonist